MATLSEQIAAIEKLEHAAAQAMFMLQLQTHHAKNGEARQAAREALDRLRNQKGRTGSDFVDGPSD